MVERLLLDVARETDRLPAVNVHPGHGSVIRLLCRHELLRVSVRGYDPLAPPRGARPLGRVKVIKAWRTGTGDYDIEHDWRLRPLRRASS